MTRLPRISTPLPSNSTPAIPQCVESCLNAATATGTPVVRALRISLASRGSLKPPARRSL